MNVQSTLSAESSIFDASSHHLRSSSRLMRRKAWFNPFWNGVSALLHSWSPEIRHPVQLWWSVCLISKNHDDDLLSCFVFLWVLWETLSQISRLQNVLSTLLLIMKFPLLPFSVFHLHAFSQLFSVLFYYWGLNPGLLYLWATSPTLLFFVLRQSLAKFSSHVLRTCFVPGLSQGPEPL